MNIFKTAILFLTLIACGTHHAFGIDSLYFAPKSFEITGFSTNSITFSAQADEFDSLIVIYTKKMAPGNPAILHQTGKLSGIYQEGDSVEGGGVVAYFGPSVTDFTIDSLQHSTGYYLKAYSFNSLYGYSDSCLTAAVSTIIIPDFSTSFGITPKNKNVLPPGWDTYVADDTLLSIISPPILINAPALYASFLTDMPTSEAVMKTCAEDYSTVMLASDGNLSEFLGDTLRIMLNMTKYSSQIYDSLYTLDFSVLYDSVIPYITDVTPTYNSASVRWLSIYDKNEISCVLKGYMPVLPVTVDSLREFTFTDLIPETEYEIFVRGIIDDADSSGRPVYSEWSKGYVFTTDSYPACTPPTGLEADVSSFKSDGSVTLSWIPTDDQFEWEVQFREYTDPDWINIEGLEECTVSINNLASETAFLWTVRASCTHNRISDWAEDATFDTSDIEYDGVSAATVDDLKIFVTGGCLNIINDHVYIKSVDIFDMEGHKIYSCAINGIYSAVIPISFEGIAVVGISLKNKVISRKVYLR